MLEILGALAAAKPDSDAPPPSMQHVLSEIDRAARNLAGELSRARRIRKPADEAGAALSESIEMCYLLASMIQELVQNGYRSLGMTGNVAPAKTHRASPPMAKIRPNNPARRSLAQSHVLGAAMDVLLDQIYGEDADE